jgi:hypothetical protein
MRLNVPLASDTNGYTKLYQPAALFIQGARLMAGLSKFGKICGNFGVLSLKIGIISRGILHFFSSHFLSVSLSFKKLLKSIGK